MVFIDDGKMNLVGNFVKARKRLGSLRGLVRMKRVLDANTVKFQTTKSLQCMQTMARVQAQIHSQRVRMAEENQALQMHLQQKCENELEKFKVRMCFFIIIFVTICNIIFTQVL